MHLHEDDTDGSVAGYGSFGSHAYSPSFRITNGVVTRQCVGGNKRRVEPSFILSIRQEARDFVNLCTIALSPDRQSLLEGEWLQVGVAEDHATRRPGAALDECSTESPQSWGWWRASRARGGNGAGARPAGKASVVTAAAGPTGPPPLPFAPSSLQRAQGRPTRPVAHLLVAPVLRLAPLRPENSGGSSVAGGEAGRDDRAAMWEGLRME